ncbi:unnamed protein product, partial [Musa hybrid cultivar]
VDFKVLHCKLALLDEYSVRKNLTTRKRIPRSMWNVATSNMSLKDRLMTGNPFIARRQHPSRSVRGPDVRLGC